MKQKRLTVKVDPHTFGGSPASENLVKILNDHHPELVTKVGSHYNQFTEHLTNCVYAAAHFPNGGLRTMMELYKKHKFDTINNSCMPDIVKSHLLNVMSTSYKIKLEIVNRLMDDARLRQMHKL